MAGVVGVSLHYCDNLYSQTAEEVPAVRLRGVRLAYYRAPESDNPSGNLVDPYDSFLKDEDGDLIITATGQEIVSKVTHSVYRGFALRTQKNSPVLVYQETPCHRWRYKSNCFGLTFTQGEYWVMAGQVEKILRDNNWQIVRPADAEPMDVAVYRNSAGCIVHTARVVGRDADGRVLVNSKNGWDREVRQVRATDVERLLVGGAS